LFAYTQLSFLSATNIGRQSSEEKIMLTVTLQGQSNPLVLRCVGRIVRGSETSLLCAVIQQNRSHIILDFSEVESIDAAGIGVLLSLQAAGTYLVLLNPTPPVRELLRVTNVDSVIEISQSMPEVVATQMQAS
jgi:anti-anti-sigma factor